MWISDVCSLRKSWEYRRLAALWALPIPAFYTCTHTSSLTLIRQWSQVYLDGPRSLGICLLHPPQAFPEERQLIGKNYVALRVVALWCGLSSAGSSAEASQTCCKLMARESCKGWRSIEADVWEVEGFRDPGEGSSLASWLINEQAQYVS